MIDWDEVLKGADWFHWTGITPALSQGAADACLEAIRAANRLGVTVSCDLNYPEKPVEIRQTGIRNHARAGSRLRCHTGK